MKLDRIELTDIHTPMALARAVHHQLGDTATPVPVVEIARALDIPEVTTGRFDGFEGMLLTNRVRSKGAILANTRHGHRRARFTIAHELGHFLMERHVLTDITGFRCRSVDMRETRESRQEFKQEVQANQFAIELLAPAPKFESCLSSHRLLSIIINALDWFSGPVSGGLEVYLD